MLTAHNEAARQERETEAFDESVSDRPVMEGIDHLLPKTNTEAEQDISNEANEDGSTTEVVRNPPDVWVRGGGFVVRRHLTQRDTLFSPTQWLYETGNKSIPIFEDDGNFEFMDLEKLEVSRETIPTPSIWANIGTHGLHTPRQIKRC